jgi:hypothetical protein
MRSEALEGGKMNLQDYETQKKRLMRFVGVPVVAFVTIAGILLSTSGVAFAQGVAQGSNYYYSDNGYPYYNYNIIDTTTGSPAYAWIDVWVDANYNAPAGYMGARAFMFYSNGSLCNEETSWIYNGSATAGFDTYVTPACGAGPVYYSQGQTRAWNGTGYDTFSSDKSPNENS